AASSPREIRPDGKSVIAQAMAGLTALLEQRLAVPGVAAQIECWTKTPDYFIAIGVCRRADHFDGALLDGSIGMLSQRHRLHQRQIAAFDHTLLHGGEQIAGAVGTLEKHVHRLLSDCRCEGG